MKPGMKTLQSFSVTNLATTASPLYFSASEFCSNRSPVCSSHIFAASQDFGFSCLRSKP